MKSFLSLAILVLLGAQMNAQCIEANLQSTWIDDGLNTDPNNWVGNIYNDIWGLHINNREYAVMGSYEGTHFIDVTDPQLPVESHFVAAAVQTENIVHRDFHDYGGYIYTVADEGSPNSTLQIIDITDLPNSVNVVYDSNALFSITHNIFIDSTHARLYTCDWESQILSLDDPENPQLLYTFNEGYVHDMYVRDNIGYLNMGNNGFMIVDFSSDSGYTVLGTLTSYPDQGYNHSGWLSEDGKHYVLADETHGTRLKVLNVEDPTDITVVALIDDGLVTSNSIAHNLIIKDDLVYVSYYYDGVQVFSIADPANPVKVAEYDTYSGTNNDFFEGAWGVYPHLASGNILVSDMQTGLYVIAIDDIDLTVDFSYTMDVNAYTIDMVTDNFNATYWLWDFGNGETSSEQYPSFTYSEVGDYDLCLTTGNSDCIETYCEEVSVLSVGIEAFDTDILDVKYDGSFLSVKSNVAMSDLNLNLVDLSGRLIYTTAIDILNESEAIELDLTAQSTSGLLILSISSEQGNFSQKIFQP